MMKRSAVSVVALLAAAGMAQAQWTDGFNRADGAVGPGWTPLSGVWAIQGLRATQTSGTGNFKLQNVSAASKYQDTVVTMDCFVNGASLQFVGPQIGLGGADGILVKLQGSGSFTSLGIYRTNNANWTGTTYLPGGTTAASGFVSLPAALSSARLKVWFPNEDVIQVEVDSDFDGRADAVFRRDGVTTIAGGFGTGQGAGAFGAGTFDNYWATTHSNRFDSFNRPDGALGGPWTIASGTWAVAGNRGTHTSGAIAEFIQYDGLSANYRNVLASVDVIQSGTNLQFAGLQIGMGGTDSIQVKLQGQTGTGNLSHIGIYHDIGGGGWGQWTGTTNLPGGGTSPNGFQALPAEAAAGRMTVWFPTPDVIRVDIDNNLDGTADWTYTRDGVSAIASNFGTGVGIAGFGAGATFDNFNTRRWNATDGFDRPNGPLGGDWTVVSGTWGVDSAQGVHTSAAANEVIRRNNVSMPYTDSVTSLDVFSGASSQYSGVVVGLGGTESILVKIQDQTAAAGFSHIGLYNSTFSGSWTGTTTLPGGATTAAGFISIPAGLEFVSARITVSFPSADVLRLEIDTDFDGKPEQVYYRSGVSSIASGLGTGHGIAAWNTTARFDNYSIGQRGMWPEAADAGELLSSANVVPSGVGPLARITGSIGADDADMYKVRICDPANFSATTVGGAGFDTQLFLFNAAGLGVASNDDNPSGGTQSTLTNAFTSSLSRGDFYLAVSAYNRDPSSAGGLIWANTPFNTERAPDGPGAGGAVSSWAGTYTARGDYTIELTGTCFDVPAQTCYANCDGSTVAPILNVNDFICFQTRYAANDPYANCDGSTVAPILNVNDFICFQTQYAAGCP